MYDSNVSMVISAQNARLSPNLDLQVFKAGDAIVVFVSGLTDVAFFEELVALLVDLRHKTEFLFIRHGPHIQLE